MDLQAHPVVVFLLAQIILRVIITLLSRILFSHQEEPLEEIPLTLHLEELQTLLGIIPKTTASSYQEMINGSMSEKLTLTPNSSQMSYQLGMVMNPLWEDGYFRSMNSLRDLPLSSKV